MTENFPDFLYNCDSDIVCHKMLQGLKQGKDLESAARTVMEGLDGAFSVIGVTGEGEFFRLQGPAWNKTVVRWT